MGDLQRTSQEGGFATLCAGLSAPGRWVPQQSFGAVQTHEGCVVSGGSVRAPPPPRPLLSRYLHPTVLYNFSGYWPNYCFVFRDDFFRRNTVPQPANCYKPRKKTIRMFDTVCENLTHIKRQFGHEMIPLASQDQHPLLYFPEMYWYCHG